MRFNIDGQEWRIKFHYPDHLTTVAEICNPDTGDYVLGSATRHTDDVNVKETGRYIAFKRVMDKLTLTSRWTADQRQLAWNAFLDRSTKHSYRVVDTPPSLRHTA